MNPKNCVLLCYLILGVTQQMSAAGNLQADTILTSSGNLIITFIGHGTLMMQHAGKTIHVDPWGKLADYATLPKADLVLITHHHGDHLDKATLSTICTDKTVILLTKTCAKELGKGIAMANGERRTESGILVEAVPAYNIVHKRPDGTPFHPKGEGNGYILTFGKTRVYVAGDTENTPEMKALKNVDVAFLPMNLPYTMTPEMVADAARAFRPRILYPYHYGETSPDLLVNLLKDLKAVEIRVRNMH
ncbi:MAG: putative Zn-dependent hydrolase of beta-lactamase fold protein [Bacteroidetes bacterium]|nr:putative Zn-dependent hydrolase of beta-lactamase fold protein [Bacteroidota bacterium]